MNIDESLQIVIALKKKSELMMNLFCKLVFTDFGGISMSDLFFIHGLPLNPEMAICLETKKAEQRYGRNIWDPLKDNPRFARCCDQHGSAGVLTNRI